MRFHRQPPVMSPSTVMSASTIRWANYKDNGFESFAFSHVSISRRNQRELVELKQAQEHLFGVLM